MQHQLRIMALRSVGFGTIAIVLVATLLNGCSDQPVETPASSVPDDPTGTVRMQLTLAGGVVLSRLDWQIVGPNNFSKSGSVDVANSLSVDFLVGGLPAGSGYSTALTARWDDGQVTCTGAAHFDVSSQTTVTVVVPLDCYAAAPEAGSALITTNSTNCATWTSLSVLPSETTVGHSVKVTVAATGADPTALTYAWSAPTGSFDTPNTANASFTCTAVGTVPITVRIDDGPIADGGSCDMARNTATAVVQCDPPSDALAGITQIAAGADSTCALKTDSTVVCWGANGSGQLGAGTSSVETCGGQSLLDGGIQGYPCSTKAVAVQGLNNATAIAAGTEVACAVLADGGASCWGFNHWGQLGDGTTTSSSVPVKVAGLANARSITIGFQHACALQSQGRVKCWGDNSLGELGGDGLLGVSAISAGSSFTCALMADTTVECWGWNFYGQLGIGTSTGPDSCGLSIYGEPCAGTPVVVPGLTGAVAIVAGEFHACALLSGGTLKCWGYNGSGQLGLGTSTGPETCGTTPTDRYPCSTTPVAVPGLKAVTAVAAGGVQSCALTVDGWSCWGKALVSLTGSSTPVPLTGVSGALSVSPGGDLDSAFTCTLLPGGFVDCWGANRFGQLGNGTTLDSASPVTVIH